jgi:hypothetical protein
MLTNAKMAPHVIWLADRSLPFQQRATTLLSARKTPPKWGRNSEVDPCLARVRREQKAAARDIRFGAHFTQM